MPDVHAKLSASGSAKWLNCPGSIELESGFPDETSEYAAEGTKAHSLGELKINLELGNISKAKYTRDVKKLGDVPADMEDHIEGYKNFVIERYNAKKKNATIAIELRLDFSRYVPEGFGTGDVVIVTDDEIEIIDLKYGKGVVVSAEENPQLRLYGLGAYEEYEYLYSPKKITYTIYQPRIDNISSWSESINELIKWGKDTVVPAADAALEYNAECKAGEYCDSHFCKARAVCRAYNQQKLELAKYEFTSPNKLTNDEIAEILHQASGLKKWVEVVEAYAIEEAIKGAEFPGWKLVEGKSSRKYSDESKAKEALLKAGYEENDIVTVKLKGITDMGKLLGKEFDNIIGEFVIKPQGKPTLVDVKDKRPALNSVQAAISDFEESENVPF